MQEQNYSFEELKAELLERLEARGCTPITITGYRYQCNSILPGLKKTVMVAIAKKRRDSIFTELLQQTWKQSVLRCPKDSGIQAR